MPKIAKIDEENLHIYLMNFDEIFRKNFTYDNINPLSTNPTKSSNTFKQFVGKLPIMGLKVIIKIIKTIKSHQKSRLHSLSRKYNFGKAT